MDAQPRIALLDLGHDVLGQGGLAKTGRTVKQHVVQGFAARLGGIDKDEKIFPRLLLADKIRQGDQHRPGLSERSHRVAGFAEHSHQRAQLFAQPICVSLVSSK